MGRLRGPSPLPPAPSSPSPSGATDNSGVQDDPMCKSRAHPRPRGLDPNLPVPSNRARSSPAAWPLLFWFLLLALPWRLGYAIEPDGTRKHIIRSAVIFRHGDRHLLPKNSDGQETPDRDTFSFLTEVGERQLHDLGLIVRLLYVYGYTADIRWGVDTGIYGNTTFRTAEFEESILRKQPGVLNSTREYENHLVAPRFSVEHDRVRITSSAKDRSLGSASAFVDGLYPIWVYAKDVEQNSGMPLKRTAIPIFTAAIEGDFDGLLRGWAGCPVYVRKIREFYASKEVHDREMMTMSLRKRVCLRTQCRSVLNVNTSAMSDWPLIHDFMINSILNTTGRSQVRPEISGEDLRQVRRLENWLNGRLYDRRRGGSHVGGPLATSISNYLYYHKSKINPSLKIFSAHRPTMTAALSAMRMDIPSAPPLGSALFFELLDILPHNNSTALDCVGKCVRILYAARNTGPYGYGTEHKKIIPLPLGPYCDGKTTCDLTQWYRGVQMGIDSATTDDLRNWCGLNDWGAAGPAPDVLERQVCVLSYGCIYLFILMLCLIATAVVTFAYRWYLSKNGSSSPLRIQSSDRRSISYTSPESTQPATQAPAPMPLGLSRGPSNSFYELYLSDIAEDPDASKK